MSYSFKSSGPKSRPDRVKPVPTEPSSRRSRSSSIASSASFASAVEAHHEDQQESADTAAEPTRFSPDEETQMVEASHSLKTAANKQFAVKDYSSAISTYDKALAELPTYLDYELAVLQSNIAACHLQLQEWKEAVESAERGLENLEREMPLPKPKPEPKNDKSSNTRQNGTTDNRNNKTHTTEAEVDENKVVELPEDEDEATLAHTLRQLDLSDQRKADVIRIRTKLLLRRARAKVMLCDQPNVGGATSTSTSAFDTSTSFDPDAASQAQAQAPSTSTSKKADPFANGSQWGHLAAALGDYQVLAEPTYFRNLPTSDQKTVIEMLRTLPGRVEAAKKREVDEMMGKLKDLGNGILRPFGLSTDMFKMQQDPNSGGWSMSFDQGGGKK